MASFGKGLVFKIAIMPEENDDNINYSEYENKYERRHNFWADKSLAQFGFANNFFLGLGIGILAYTLNEATKTGSIEFARQYESISWRISLTVLSSISALASLVYGILTLLSRLHDLRLTRHINTVRKKAASREEDKFLFKVQDIDIDGIPLFPNFIDTVRSRYYFIEENEIIKGREIECKFRDLRKRTLLLGRYSWVCFNKQIVYLGVSVIIFTIALFF